MKNECLGFAVRLRCAIRESGITYITLANKMGIKPHRIIYYTQGKGYPKIDLACRLADELNIEVEWLLTGRGCKKKECSEYKLPVLLIETAFKRCVMRAKNVCYHSALFMQGIQNDIH